MKLTIFILMLMTVHHTTSTTIEDFNNQDPVQMVRRFFEYFRQPDPRGIPVLHLPARLDLDGPLVTTTLTLTNYSLIGHSTSKLEWLLLDVVNLTALMTFDLPIIEIRGNYSMPGLWSSSEGYLDAMLAGVTVDNKIGIDFNDSSLAIYLNNMEMDLMNEELDFNMTGLNFEHDMLLSSGTIHAFFRPLFYQMFSVCEPWFLFLINEELGRCFEMLPDAPFVIPDNVSPLVGFLNIVLTHMNKDLQRIPDKQFKVIGLHVTLSETTLFGLNDIAEIEECTMEYKPKEVTVNLTMTMRHLFLRFKYRVKQRKIFLDYSKTIKCDIIRPTFMTKFTLDPGFQTPPQVTDLRLRTDGLKIHTRGKGLFGPMKRALVYIIDKQRDAIVDRITSQLKKQIQNKLNVLDVEEEIVKLVKKKTTQS